MMRNGGKKVHELLYFIVSSLNESRGIEHRESRIWCKKKKKLKRETVIGHLAIWSHHESDKSSHYIFFILFEICTRSHSLATYEVSVKRISCWNSDLWALLAGNAATAHHFLFLRLRMMVHTLQKKTFFFLLRRRDDNDEIFYNEHYTSFVQYVMRQIVPMTKHQTN